MNADNPITDAREVTFSVDDADDGLDVAAAVVPIFFSGVNDPPYINSGVIATYVEDSEPIVIDSNLVLTDLDGPEILATTVRISSGFTPGEDLLAAVDTQGFDVAYDDQTGVLTVTGSMPDTTCQKVLRSVSYHNTNGADPDIAPRIVTFEVSDGQFLSSATATISIVAVNDPPQLIVGGEVSFVEGDPPQIIDPNIIITDPDGPDLNTAVITIAQGFSSNEDVLSAVDTLGVSGSYSESSGILTLTGTASAADYQTVLRTVAYLNTNADDPDMSPRAINFLINDGSGPVMASAIVNLFDLNDGPFVANAVADITTYEDSDDILIDLSAVFRDPDDPNAQFSYDINNDNPDLITTGLPAANLMQIEFAANSFGGAEIVIEALSSSRTGTDSTVTDTIAVTVLPVNDPPLLADISDQMTNEDEALELLFSFTDADTSDSLTIEFTSYPSALVFTPDNEDTSGYHYILSPAEN